MQSFFTSTEKWKLNSYTFSNTTDPLSFPDIFHPGFMLIAVRAVGVLLSEVSFV